MTNKVYESQAEFSSLAILHRWLAIGTGLLLLTGLLLYAEPLRGLLAPVRVPLKYVHIFSGLLLAMVPIISIMQWGRFLLRRGLVMGRRLNILLSVIWIGLWTITGLLMWMRGTVPYTVSNAATSLHDWLTWLSLPWVVGHIAFRLEKVRRPDGRIELGAWLARPTTRRGLLNAALAMVAVWGLGKLWIRSNVVPEPETATEPVDPSTLLGGGMKGRFRLYFVNNTIPEFNPETWRLQVGDKSLTWADYNNLPLRTMASHFHCVTGWSVFDITWEGVRLSELLKVAGFKQAPVIIFHSGDGEYTDSLTWEQAQHPDVMLAHKMEGRPLPQAQGGPLRLLIPHMYGYKSVKWVEAVYASNDAAYRGYWEMRGYPVDALLEQLEPVRGT